MNNFLMRNMTNKLSNLKSKLFLAILFFCTAAAALALPSVDASNLQTTAGVSTTLSGSALNIIAPNKSVLTWQSFGSGVNAIASGDTINYTLPSASSSVLNIVGGGVRTQIDGAITSNGNVLVLNPSGIIIGGGARIDTNSFTMSTSGDTVFADYYFRQHGKLPIQDNLGTYTGTASVTSGAIVNVTDSISIFTKNADIGGALIQGTLNISADGTVVVGSGGITYVGANTNVVNSTGTTTLGTAGNTLLINGNTVVSSVSGVITNAAGTNFVSKSLTANAANISIGKVNSAAVNLTSTSDAVLTVNSNANPVVTVKAAGAVTINSSNSMVINLENNPSVTGVTSVTATGALTLGAIHVTSPVGATVFSGSSVSDQANNNFVYGPVTFIATSGDVSVTKSGHSFGPVGVRASGNATVNESAALNLGTSNAVKLNVTSKEFVFQTGAVTATSALISTTGNVTLANTSNNIGSASISGADVSLINNNSIALSNITAMGNLSVTAAGNITQTADTNIKSIGNSSFTGTGLTLANIGNAFGALAIDVTATGFASVTEESTLNLTALRAATGTFKSSSSIITTGTNLVFADSLNFEAVSDIILLGNTRITTSLTVRALGLADLSALSFAANLNSKYPLIVASIVKTPTP